jgi:hypothetical protein
MIRKRIVPAIVILSAFLGTACKKDVDTKDVRFTAYSDFDGVNLRTIKAKYDGSGRIIQLLHKENNAPEIVFYDVSYKGNEIIMSRSGTTDTITSADSIILLVDAANMVQRKIGKLTIQMKPFPGGPAQRIFSDDTTLYEYDANSLLKKKTLHRYDSSWWMAYGQAGAEAQVVTEVTDYINVRGNVISYTMTRNETRRMYEYGTRSVENTSTTEDWSFDYGLNYPNKTDFSNAAVLGQACVWVDAPMNKNYRNLPNQYRYTSRFTDANGSVYQKNYNGVYVLKYNSYGFLASVGEEARSKYYYNK